MTELPFDSGCFRLQLSLRELVPEARSVAGRGEERRGVCSVPGQSGQAASSASSAATRSSGTLACCSSDPPRTRGCRRATPIPRRWMAQPGRSWRSCWGTQRPVPARRVFNRERARVGLGWRPTSVPTGLPNGARPQSPRECSFPSGHGGGPTTLDPRPITLSYRYLNFVFPNSCVIPNS